MKGSLDTSGFFLKHFLIIFLCCVSAGALNDLLVRSGCINEQWFGFVMRDFEQVSFYPSGCCSWSRRLIFLLGRHSIFISKLQAEIANFLYRLTHPTISGIFIFRVLIKDKILTF